MLLIQKTLRVVETKQKYMEIKNTTKQVQQNTQTSVDNRK